MNEIRKENDGVKAEYYERNQQKLLRGGYISLPNNLKMKFFGDLSMDEVWGVFVKHFDFLSRKQLGDRNYEKR